MALVKTVGGVVHPRAALRPQGRRSFDRSGSDLDPIETSSWQLEHVFFSFLGCCFILPLDRHLYKYRHIMNNMHRMCAKESKEQESAHHRSAALSSRQQVLLEQLECRQLVEIAEAEAEL